MSVELVAGRLRSAYLPPCCGAQGDKMHRILIGLAAVAFSASASAQQQQPTIERLQAAALESDRAYGIVESLVTEIGPRLAGSEAEARARAWAVAMLRANGFTNVRIEPF